MYVVLVSHVADDTVRPWVLLLDQRYAISMPRNECYL
jgi:hypothetical protein